MLSKNWQLRLLVSFPFHNETGMIAPLPFISSPHDRAHNPSNIPLNEKILKTHIVMFSSPQILKVPSLNEAAAAKSLQSYLTLCHPIDGSPPGSSVPGILQARMLEWVAISFSNAWKWKVKVKSLSRVQLLATPWTAAYQALPSMGFSRQEYWRGSSYKQMCYSKCKALILWFLHLKINIKSIFPIYKVCFR